ncbi:unnamed protein product [Blepharisma stoltei]|uniref:Uncharacterized protein n=1 Tax=Blepharisma stoltei TaxID=1481888 RepID=A0AAU9J525_9CILI|nr:unnamed protein product [Blepharisma stoltei]
MPIQADPFYNNHCQYRLNHLRISYYILGHYMLSHLWNVYTGGACTVRVWCYCRMFRHKLRLYRLCQYRNYSYDMRYKKWIYNMVQHMICLCITWY